MKPFIVCRSEIQDGLVAGATAKVVVPLPHGLILSLAAIFVTARTLGGSEALLSAYATHPHDGLIVTVRNDGTADAGHFRVDALIVVQ
jgi:hypothetical protein